jgi:hypothetical protein
MKKKLITLAMTLSMITGFSANSYAVETSNFDYKVSENVLDYTPDPNSPFIQNNRKELYNKMVDPGKAMGLSALYFGLGQLYSGETQKGALILAGGTLLTATVFLVALPNLSKRQESVAGTGTALSLLALGTAYVMNIKDAHDTAENINAEVQKKLLMSDNYLYQLEKINISSKESTIGLTYNLKF